MLNLVVRFALDGEAATTTQGSTGSTLFLFAILALFFGAWYFLAIRPQRKKEKELRAQLEKMRVGDSVITIGGLCGRIANINKSLDEVTIMTSAANSLVTFKKSAINTVIPRDAKIQDPAEKTDKKGKLTIKKKEAEEAVEEPASEVVAESAEKVSTEEN